MERRSFLTAAGAAMALSGSVGLSGSFPSLATASNNPKLTRALTGTEPLFAAVNDLSPYTGPWTDWHLHHLLRRSMFGVPIPQFLEAKALGSMGSIIDKLLDPKAPFPEKPGSWVDDLLVPDRTITDPEERKRDFANKNNQNTARFIQLRNWWIDTIAREHLSIRERMTLMWSNHFVTSIQAVKGTPYMYYYLDRLRRSALGNVKQLTYDISIDGAMLIYLNGNQSYYGKNPFGKNVGDAVNENYARELMELFTLGLVDPITGEDNYTEADIQQAAQALSGWQPGTKAPFTGLLLDQSHNAGSKTFFGQTGNFGLQDIVNMIFAKKNGFNAAYFISAKIYSALVYAVPNPEVVTAMANVLIQSNWEIAPVVKALLGSAHFYDENVIAAMLKSPTDFVVGLLRQFNISYPAFDPTDPPGGPVNQMGTKTYKDNNKTLTFLGGIIGEAQGQSLLSPPNVKGWPGGRNWISTGTFPQRQSISYSAVSYPNLLDGSPKARYAKLTFDPLVWAKQIPNAEGLTSTEIATELHDAIQALDAGAKDAAKMQYIISGGVPEIDYYLQDKNAAILAQYAVTLPEYQLI